MGFLVFKSAETIEQNNKRFWYSVPESSPRKKALPVEWAHPARDWKTGDANSSKEGCTEGEKRMSVRKSVLDKPESFSARQRLRALQMGSRPSGADQEGSVLWGCLWAYRN